jgi:16S rRNA (guanine1516-N2)-methyltransferase
LVKKEAQFLQELVSWNPREDLLLLKQARSLARQRTVVKRPVHAECLGQNPASFSLRGKTIRFDIYLSR